MASQINSQIPQKKELFFIELKVGKDQSKYRAWVGHYVVRGKSRGDKEAVEAVVRRIAEAKVDLIDQLKDMIAMVSENVAKASETSMVDIGTVMGTYFHLGEYLGVMVRLERLNGAAGGRWWGQVRVMFKGADGNMALSRHVIERYVEFYSNTVSYDKIYSILCEMARMVFNAYIWAHRKS
jgi:hypothetical protein